MTGRLVRLALRRDRVLVAAWLAVLVLTTASSAAATIDLYPDAAAGAAAARAVNGNPVMQAMYGPIADERSVGALAVFKLTLLFGALVMLFMTVLVRRHSRTEEESGRAELLGATGIDRGALLRSAVVEAVLVAVVLAVLVALGNGAAGLPWTGSATFALAWLGLALVAVGVAAVAAQLTASARSMAGIVTAVLLVAYVVRAAADLTDTDWLAWLSPFGWASRMRPYAGDRWWLVGLSIAATVLLLALAAVLNRRRDVGEGLVAARPGPSRGRLGSLLGLQLRLQRAGTVGWAVGLACLGALLGAVAPSVADFADSPAVRDMLRRAGGEGALQDTFLAVEISFMAVAAAAYAVSLLTRTAGDEEGGHAEKLLSTPASRSRLFGTTLGSALLAPAVLLGAFGLAAGLSFGLVVGDLGEVPRLAGAALAQLPAVWVVAGLTALLFGLRAGGAVVGWALLVGFLVLGQIGELLGLPDWLVDASPFAHTPRMPSSAFEVTGDYVVLVVVALVGAAAGWAAYVRRDVG